MSAVTHDSHLQDCLYISWHPTMTVLPYKFIDVLVHITGVSSVRVSWIFRSASRPLRLAYKYQAAWITMLRGACSFSSRLQSIESCIRLNWNSYQLSVYSMKRSSGLSTLFIDTLFSGLGRNHGQLAAIVKTSLVGVNTRPAKLL